MPECTVARSAASVSGIATSSSSTRARSEANGCCARGPTRRTGGRAPHSRSEALMVLAGAATAEVGERLLHQVEDVRRHHAAANVRVGVCDHLLPFGERLWRQGLDVQA